MDFDRVGAHDPVMVTGEKREAAIVIPVLSREGGEAILFTKRADHLSEHPGQMAFPGGGREPLDTDLLATALREANEEIGLDPTAVHVVGRLDDIRTITSYSVRPFVGRIPDREYRPDDAEVAEIVTLPVAALTDLDNYESERRDHPHYGEVRLHFFYINGYAVWGATAQMLVQLLELATDWEMPPEPDRYAGPGDDLPERVRDEGQ
jgi:8-oxo-dGTP pyrophosphatase MutT (NUDIX family)